MSILHPLGYFALLFTNVVYNLQLCKSADCIALLEACTVMMDTSRKLFHTQCSGNVELNVAEKLKEADFQGLGYDITSFSYIRCTANSFSTICQAKNHLIKHDKYKLTKLDK